MDEGFDALLGRYMALDGPRELIRLIRRLPPSRIPVISIESVGIMRDLGLLTEADKVYPPISVAEMLVCVAARIDELNTNQQRAFHQICVQCFQNTAQWIHEGIPPHRWYH